MNPIELVRTLAMEDSVQNIYILAKEINGIKLFENDKDFTYIQNVFLKYINFYYNLYSDIAIGEVTDIVLRNFIFSDSYMMFKNYQEKNKFKSQNQEKNKDQLSSLNTTQWIFKHPKTKI